MDNLVKIDNFTFENYARIIKSKDGKVLSVSPWFKNKVVLTDDCGRNLLLKALTGQYLEPVGITHLEIGTGTTAATDNDDQTETFAARGSLGYASAIATVANFKFYLADAALPDDDYTELTMWINGLAGEGTGYLFNRIVFASTPYTKSAGDDTTVQVRLTLTG